MEDSSALASSSLPPLYSPHIEKDNAFTLGPSDRELEREHEQNHLAAPQAHRTNPPPSIISPAFTPPRNPGDIHTTAPALHPNRHLPLLRYAQARTS